MQINLRKAAVVQQIIQDEIKRLGQEDTKIRVSLFEENIQARLDEQSSKVIATAQRVSRFMEANRYFRATVAKKNAEFGIADYLAEDAMLAAMEQRIASLIDADARPELDVLQREIAARRENKDEKVSIYGGGREYEISVNVLPKSIIEGAKGELENVRRRRRKIKDEMVTINVRNEFEVPEQIAAVLVELGLD